MAVKILTSYDFSGNLIRNLGSPTQDGDAISKAYLEFVFGPGSVTEEKLDDAAVSTDKLADDAVTAAKIADNAVGADQIAAGAVGTSELGAGAVTTAKLGDAAVTQSKIATDAVGADQIVAGSVGTSELADDAVTSAKIADDAVGADQIATDAVGSDQIAAGAVGSSELAEDAVTRAKIADDAVGLDELDDAVYSVSADGGTLVRRDVDGNIVANELSAAKLVSGEVQAPGGAVSFGGSLIDNIANPIDSDDAVNLGYLQSQLETLQEDIEGLYEWGDGLEAVTPGSGDDSTVIIHVRVNESQFTFNEEDEIELRPESIGTPLLADNGVTTAKIADDAVTSAKIASGAVGTGELADDAVTAAKIADDAVGADQIAAGAVGTAELASGAVTTAKLGADAVNGDKIADDSIGAEHLIAGAVGTSELADEAVTLGKIATTAYDTAATADKLMMRDANGRTAAADPINSEHVATKGYVDQEVQGLEDRVEELETIEYGAGIKKETITEEGESTTVVSLDVNSTHFQNGTTQLELNSSLWDWLSIKRDHAQLVGNGVDTVFTITHGMSTRHVMVQVVSKVSPYNDVEVAVERPTQNTVKVTFEGEVPDSSEYIVLIQRCGVPTLAEYLQNSTLGQELPA